MSSVSGNTWIDDELRNVAVPNDLTAKLRAIASPAASVGTSALGASSIGIASVNTDSQLDCALKAVIILPANAELLRKRLRGVRSLDDQDLDDELRHVVLPIDLQSKLRSIAADDTPGAESQSVRASLQMPVFLTSKLRWLHANVRPLAIAASLLLAAGVGYLTAIVATDLARGVQDPVGPGTIATNGPAQRINSVPPIVPAPVDRPHQAIVDNKHQPAPTQLPDTVFPSPLVPGSILPENQRPTENVVVDVKPGNGSTNEKNNLSPVVNRHDPDTLFADVPGNELSPVLRSVPEPVWRGISPPRVRGYDLTFQLRHGVHPFVSPATNKVLETSQVPVVTSSASFDLAAQAVAQRKLPPAYRIRTEEFLAAMDYQFPLPTGSKPVAIRTAAGPSPWGTPAATGGLSLMQVGVQAGILPRDGDAGTHLIILLDRSASMRSEGRWQAVLLGLTHFARQMTAKDRISLITFGDKSELVADRAGATDMPAVLQKLEQVTPNGSGDFVNAVQLAAGVAKPRAKDVPKLAARLALLTDGLLLNGSRRLDDSDAQVEKTLAEVVTAGARLDVIDVRQEATLDSQLGSIAAAGQSDGNTIGRSMASSGGQVRHAGTADRIRWELLEVLTDRSQVVAADVSIKVTFKPDSVSMYRLLGHEATSVVGMMSTSVEADLRSGEAATGLFEVALTPDGGPTVALVEVSWLDTKTGQPQTSRQTISRLQFATSMAEAPFSLQLAAMAAETAEVLRDSYFAPPNAHSLAEVADVGRQLNSRLRSRPSFVRLMTVVEQAQRSQAVGN